MGSRRISGSTGCCLQGPALLFERYMKNGDSRKFFACSAFRDRKQCSFFRWMDDVKVGSNNATGNTNFCAQGVGAGNRKRFLKFKKLPLSERSICCTCGLLLLGGEATQHTERGHQVKHKINRAALRHPTTLFVPHEDNKTYAQYLFTDSTVDFILSTLENLKCTHILCIGAPRIHEAITLRQRQQDTTLSSLLLDLDARYAQVYTRKQMCLYNMFNHHFFDQQGEGQFRSFLKEAGAGLVLVTDPPFGGMVEPLAATFKKIEETWKAETKLDRPLPMLWFFPYFMEKRICDCIPSLTMLDYKVDYDNHSLFKSKDGKRKKGSPVRIFTNLAPTSLPLPTAEGYWFCEECQRYSAPENKHCAKCKSCTSKDGTTYRHCDLCQKCVKLTRVHCDACGTCDLPSHVCGQQHGAGCHICGAMDHKRRDCPQRHDTAGRKSNRKRKGKQEHGKMKKKLRLS
ncbi:rRNA N6-adenosine-methyltransferase ZCCHC4-like isoform X2 [Littorina saxatilis]|uniref:rRNA N6-adenosine-methyltransferase ZCCHC4-like isoform X2 n=1 Tax=Littorina saxatilis TaxID=31220 RepID=UPI0038B43471